MLASRIRTSLCPTSEAGRKRLLSLTDSDLAVLRNRGRMRLYRLLSSPKFAGTCLAVWGLGMAYLLGWPGAIPEGVVFTSSVNALGGGGVAAFILGGAGVVRISEEAFLLQPLQQHPALCEAMLAAVKDIPACQQYRDQLIAAKRELLVADAQAVLSLAMPLRMSRQRVQSTETWQSLVCSDESRA